MVLLSWLWCDGVVACGDVIEDSSKAGCVWMEVWCVWFKVSPFEGVEPFGITETNTESYPAPS